MRGRITMLGISRWSEEYNYKIIERFFDKKESVNKRPLF